ncbi:MAG: hypothetical protein WDM71_09300 [Ferruginibacter sp.]
MQKLFSGKNLMILAATALSLSACKDGELFGKKKEKSSVTVGIMMIKTWVISM